jgi:hypothetical protein
MQPVYADKPRAGGLTCGMPNDLAYEMEAGARLWRLCAEMLGIAG